MFGRALHWLLLVAGLLLPGCRSGEDRKAPSAGTEGNSRGSVKVIAAPDAVADASALIREEAARAEAENRKLVVYVGAPWCEPCRRFHEAAKAGELDDAFPQLSLLEFDRDKHEAALQAAGCESELIPLFARPSSDGKCSDRRVEGAIKGPGAVAFITPRLKTIL